MIEAHPLADELPLIEGPEFDELVASIKKDGLIDEIVLCDGKILDGRNRYRACLAAGVEPAFTLIEMSDPADLARFVMAKNLSRRHLSDAQRSVIAGRLIALQGVKPQDATRMLNVGERTARKAAVVVKHGTGNVVQLMTRGDLSVDAAYKSTRAGRPVGNAQVTKLRRVLEDLEQLHSKQNEIVLHWPGDPDLNVRIAKASQFFASLVKSTREPDHAPAVA